MVKALRRTVLGVAAALLLAHPLVAANGNLVGADWLAAHLKDDAIVILDASPAKIYAEKHIPGAVNVNMLMYGVPDMAAADMEKLYQSWGISPGKTVVIYDEGGSIMATRLFFALDYDGFPAKNIAILDGGLAKWQAAGSAVTKDVPPPPKKGSFNVVNRNENLRARLPEVLAASGDPVNSVLIEGLSGRWHFGEIRPFNKGGHIPQGILMPSTDFYNADRTFKSPDEIRKMLDYNGVRREQNIYTYCGGGVAASVPFFALKFIAGYPVVKLYTGSEMDWLRDERDLPYWTYDAPFLMRDASWLQFWGGAIIRTYLTPNVSIVDVRPADAFNEGHVPFSVNVPADVFRSNLATPAKLTAILGPAGVDAAHEAVVVSGGGLTKDSALAFVMLEKIGQKKVAVLMESVDQWSTLGFAVKKEATALRPADYAAKPRDGVIIADPASTRGLYPKVFVASGASVPAKSPDGKVVHVPYTDLLNADGTPKAAKDIWSVLSKAGVPRYAELVCFSDDPGEAAANYFVLKLMGYPDIKVLVQ